VDESDHLSTGLIEQSRGRNLRLRRELLLQQHRARYSQSLQVVLIEVRQLFLTENRLKNVEH